MDLYSAFIVVPHTQGAQVWITQCYLQITRYLQITLSGSGSQVCEILGDLRYSLPTSLSQCIYMSRGLASERLVT